MQSLSIFKKRISDIYTRTILNLMSSQPVGYRVVRICLFIGRGSEAVKVGGSVIYGIPFDSWGKISTGTLSCLLLH